ncbi:Flp family type IVb pilin [Vibrio rhodolitus]|uniref:Flp family type IVb pilin n=1 Tax=Vibrio rhodolitus TaxID=2231649 RepID=UPI000E0C76D7|nr:Flp family type IVb pilin [Vibrio rhodolitus]
MFLTKYIQIREDLRNFCHKEDGVTAIEYALVAVAIAGIVAVVFSGDTGSLQKALSDAMTKISTQING